MQIDHDDPERNMFGIASCPDCGCTRRWPTQQTDPKHPNCILCDQCGRVEQMDADTLVHFGVPT